MEHDKERKHAHRERARQAIDIPTALETGQAPRPSQAEGDRQEIEEDIDERASRDRDVGTRGDSGAPI
jgi:hypothetical protein